VVDYAVAVEDDEFHGQIFAVSLAPTFPNIAAKTPFIAIVQADRRDRSATRFIA
jgi:hypothetical protein